MFILVLVGGLAAAFLLLCLCLWALSAVIDKGIKDYIDYAKEGKDRGSR
jgi:4-hydroxybenzoate polyprenyltransferase